MTATRFLVGIDLGTTNSSLAYVDLQRSTAGGGAPVVLPIPQLVAPGRAEARETLPSFLYLPAEEDRASIGDAASAPSSRPIVGVLARDQGAVRPDAQVSSAKSWLCHPTADRTARILPWGADAPSLSPVEASSRILGHLRDAWNEGPARGRAEWRLDRQDVVLAVPASFDQEARELTLEAARDAGLAHVTLLEEPLAAFYAWTASHHRTLAKVFSGGERVLVCDVGGGTTDFTLITVRVENGVVAFEREAVGEHLLLGGDNLDLALARRLEGRFGGRTLSLVQRLALKRSVSSAKERLLSEPAPDGVAITVLGAGRGVVGGSLTADLTREDVVEVLAEGFLPVVPSDARPQRGTRTGLQEMGLPYAADPAITRHLAEFLGGARPDAVLFNGGFFTPALARDRLLQVLSGWFDLSGAWRPAVLENASPAAAVALGAASYALVRRSGGLRVRAGSSRAYYIGIARGERAAVPAAKHEAGRLSALCILPRGTDEGTSFHLAGHQLSVVTNRPVSFPLFSSATRHDAAGDLIEVEEAELHRHAPLATVLRYGRKSRHLQLGVGLSAAFTETGTLEVTCESASSEHRWRLQFQLRGERETPAAEGEPDENAVSQVPPDRVEAAQAAIAAVFGDRENKGKGEASPGGSPNASPSGPDSLPALLEQTIGFGRIAWPTPVIRALADTLLQHADGRRRGSGYEARWLNLAGFCLRPGFGAPLDEWRVGRLRGIYVEGLVFASDPQCQVEWVVAWQRVAGGLKAGQQQELYQRYGTLLGVRGPKGAKRLNAQVEREAWRLLASLEHLPAAERVRIGELLLDRVRRDPGNASYLWAVGRVGARTPAYGPLSAVVPAERAAAWIGRLLALRTLTAEGAAAIAQMGARADDPPRDIDEGTRTRAVTRLEEAGFAAETQPLLEVVPLDDRQGFRRFGEALPAGLRLSNSG
ncbi:MAG: molecular chaperone DnaK [Acidobacteria bacterium]|nr:MAG: molecular chaperone DnaK [Acidobacteriota bacterium]